MIRNKKENDWHYNFVDDTYWTLLEHRHGFVKVIIDGDDYAAVCDYTWTWHVSSVISTRNKQGVGKSLLHEIMGADEGELVVRKDKDDPTVFDARRINLILLASDRESKWRKRNVEC